MNLKFKQYLQFLKVGICNLKAINKKLPNYIIQSASERFFDYIETPYILVRPPKPSDIDWHEHICLPLRLGGTELYKAICPYAQNKDFYAEHENECDWCKNLVIVDSPREHILRVIQKDLEV